MMTKLKFPAGDDDTRLIPISIPVLDDVRAFAADLHHRGEAWQGEAFGWSAEYNPQRDEPPLDSHMTFTPADFCIGESGIWFFSLQWEGGRNAPAPEFIDDRNIIRRE